MLQASDAHATSHPSLLTPRVPPSAVALPTLLAHERAKANDMRETRELRQILLHLSEQHHITHERAHAFDRRESKAMSPHRQHAPHATRHTPHATRHMPHATRHTPLGTHHKGHTQQSTLTHHMSHAKPGTRQTAAGHGAAVGHRHGHRQATGTQTVDSRDRHTGETADSTDRQKAHRATG